MTERLAQRLTTLRTARRPGFVPFIMGGDPDAALCADILRQLPAHGADIIELGMPFSDPMADGPAIAAAGKRALAAGMNLRGILRLVAGFRTHDAHTPLVLMGYANPVYRYGIAAFMHDAAAAGADALILVDAPLEEMAEFEQPARAAGLAFIRLLAPTTPAARLSEIARDAQGFLYYISTKGITGGRAIDTADLNERLNEIRTHTPLPLAVGFGIATREDVRAVAAASADLIVVGSAIVRAVETHTGKNGLVEAVLTICKDLSAATH